MITVDEWKFNAEEVGMHLWPDRERVLELFASFRAFAKNNPKARLAIDLETTGLDPHTGDITIIAFSWSGRVVAIVRPEDLPTEEFNSICSDPEYRKVFHNAKFDMKWLMVKFGTEFENADCTYIMRRLTVCGIAVKSTLKDCAAQYLAYDMDKEIRDSFIGNTEITEEMARYAAIDVAVTWSIYPKVDAVIRELNLNEVYEYIEKPCIPVVAAMEVRGVRVNVSFLLEMQKKLEAKAVTKQKEIDDRLRSLNAMPSVRRKLLQKDKKAMGILKDSAQWYADMYVFDVQETLLLTSPKQVTECLNNIGFNVKASKKDVLEAPTYTQESLKEAKKRFGMPAASDEQVLKIGYDLIEQILDLRAIYHALNSFVIPLQADHINKVTGRIHPSFNQMGTDTGRFSSSEPNFQNMPSPDKTAAIFDGEKFRKFAVASSGMKSLIFDYSGCELRILADITNDPNLIASAAYDDMHTQNASFMYRCKPEEVTKAQRAAAKTGIFLDVYGGGVALLAARLKIPLDQAKTIRETFKATFAVKERWAKQVQHTAVTEGYAMSMSGRKRFFEIPVSPVWDAKDPEGFKFAMQRYNAQKASIERQAQNMPIQATNADITKLAMVWTAPIAKKYGGHLLVCVHDELVFEIPEEHAEKAFEEIKAAMLEAEQEFLTKVPCVVDGKIADFWNK